MPIFEYHCDSCGHRFEKLVRGVLTAPTDPACPSCGTADGVHRVLSSFGVSGASSRGGPSFGAAGGGGHTHAPGVR